MVKKSIKLRKTLLNMHSMGQNRFFKTKIDSNLHK